MNNQISIALIVIACCAIAALVCSILFRRKEGVHERSGRKDRADGSGTINDLSERLSENDHVFDGFIKHHEKRILAFLIESAAAKSSLDREDVLRLRKKYGTELTRPAYDAQEQLGKCGIAPMAVTRLQKAWIIRNGGNPNVHPSTREVERILMERNENTAKSICDAVGT